MYLRIPSERQSAQVNATSWTVNDTKQLQFNDVVPIAVFYIYYIAIGIFPNREVRPRLSVWTNIISSVIFHRQNIKYYSWGDSWIELNTLASSWVSSRKIKCHTQQIIKVENCSRRWMLSDSCRFQLHAQHFITYRYVMFFKKFKCFNAEIQTWTLLAGCKSVVHLHTTFCFIIPMYIPQSIIQMKMNNYLTLTERIFPTFAFRTNTKNYVNSVSDRVCGNLTASSLTHRRSCLKVK